MNISDSPAKGRRFCKIVLSEISLHNKLMIPRKFVRKYGKHLSVHVYLKAPRGGVWPVDLVRYGSEAWLQSGWPEFARFYSLCFGHFLVFKYRGNSRFNVFIYDKSGIEINYPLASSVTNAAEQDILNLGKLAQVEKRMASDIVELKACKNTGADSECIEACHIGASLMRNLQLQKTAKVDDNTQPLDMLMPKKLEINFNDSLHQDRSIKGGTDRGEGNSTALAVTKVYRSNKPSFVLTVVPSHLRAKTRVNIKKAFAQRYMKSTQNFNVCLQVEEKIWAVTCTVSRNRYRFGKGWSKFVRGNSLSVGDVCVFELINQAQMLLKVFIYRSAEC